MPVSAVGTKLARFANGSPDNHIEITIKTAINPNVGRPVTTPTKKKANGAIATSARIRRIFRFRLISVIAKPSSRSHSAQRLISVQAVRFKFHCQMTMRFFLKKQPHSLHHPNLPEAPRKLGNMKGLLFNPHHVQFVTDRDKHARQHAAKKAENGMPRNPRASDP